MPRSNQQQPHSVTINMEIVEVLDDYLKCEHIGDIYFTDDEGEPSECPQCDDGKWASAVDYGGEVWGPFVTVAECRELANDCVDDGVVIVPVAKPIQLQKTPWDKKTITYSEGKETEFTITYTYQGADSQKRIAKYSDENERCKGGDHLEVVWPAYNARIGKRGKKGYVKGDMIRVIKMGYGKADVGVDKIIDEADDAEKAEKEIPQDLRDCQYSIDQNADGRTWSDDCGKGGGGGSVWV